MDLRVNPQFLPISPAITVLFNLAPSPYKAAYIAAKHNLQHNKCVHQSRNVEWPQQDAGSFQKRVNLCGTLFARRSRWLTPAKGLFTGL